MATTKRKLCTATTRSGDPCKNAPRHGFTVCRMHGAGTKVRVERGERKDPGTVALRHGLFAKGAKGEIAKRAKRYEEEDAGDLFDLKRQQSVLWAALELADESERYDDIAKLVNAMVRVSRAHQRFEQAGAKMVPESQVVGLVAATLGWLQEIVADRQIAREDIHQELAQRLLQFAQKLGTTIDDE